MPYNLQDGKLVIAPQDKNAKTLDQLTNLNSKLQQIATQHNLNVDEVETILNGLKSDIDSLGFGSEEDRQAIRDVVEALKNTEGDIGVETLKAIDVIADRFNEYKVTDSINAVYNAETGSFVVDVSAYGFATKTDYTVVLAPEGIPVGKLPHMTFTKTDKDNVAVKVIDGEYLLPVAHPYDGSTDGAAFNIVGTITYAPAEISFKVTDYLGNEQTIGAE